MKKGEKMSETQKEKIRQWHLANSPLRGNREVAEKSRQWHLANSPRRGKPGKKLGPLSQERKEQNRQWNLAHSPIRGNKAAGRNISLGKLARNGTGYYQDWRWDPKLDQTVRLAYIRDNYTCQCCGQTNLKGQNCHGHHIYPGKEYEPYRFISENILTLCRSCHQSLERQLQKGFIPDWYEPILQTFGRFVNDNCAGNI